MIKAVITDCFGVFYTDPIAVYQHDKRTPDHIVAALHDIHDRAAVGELSKPAYIERIARLLQKSSEAIEAEFFGDTKRDQDALAYIGSLRPVYKTVLLSNGGEGMVEERFSQQELQQYFDEVVLSYKLKTAKPDPAIFRWVCERLEVSPEETVLLDDDRVNYETAIAVGMNAILFRDLTQAKAELDELLATQNQ